MLPGRLVKLMADVNLVLVGPLILNVALGICYMVRL